MTLWTSTQRVRLYNSAWDTSLLRVLQDGGQWLLFGLLPTWIVLHDVVASLALWAVDWLVKADGASRELGYRANLCTVIRDSLRFRVEVHNVVDVWVSFRCLHLGLVEIFARSRNLQVHQTIWCECWLCDCVEAINRVFYLDLDWLVLSFNRVTAVLIWHTHRISYLWLRAILVKVFHEATCSVRFIPQREPMLSVTRVHQILVKGTLTNSWLSLLILIHDLDIALDFFLFVMLISDDFILIVILCL